LDGISCFVDKRRDQDDLPPCVTTAGDKARDF
jgi:hypothetical protein